MCLRSLLAARAGSLSGPRPKWKGTGLQISLIFWGTKTMSETDNEYEYGLVIRGKNVRRSKAANPFEVGEYLHIPLGVHWRVIGVMPPYEEDEHGTVVIEPWEGDIPITANEADTEA